jgi:hypothetical protein
MKRQIIAAIYQILEQNNKHIGFSVLDDDPDPN